MNVNVKYVDLPCTIRGLAVKAYDGGDFYTIMLNSRMSAEMQAKTYRHEMEHIINDDFSSDLPIDYIESIRHHD